MTIAILTRNRWELLDRCLVSLRDQAARADVPIVVLVNGSDDDSAERTRLRHPGVEVHESPVNLGCPAGRNLLTRLCATDWVVYVDDDGTAVPGFVDTLHEEIRRAPSRWAVVAGYFVDPELDPDARRPSGAVGTFCAGVCAIRRDAFLRLGGYPEDGLRQGEEGDLAIKLHDAGLAIHRSGDLILHHPLTMDRAKRLHLLRTGLRQALLTGVRFCPWWMVPGWVVWKLVVFLRVAVDIRGPRSYLGGLVDAARALPRVLASRRPVRARTLLATSSRFRPGPR